MAGYMPEDTFDFGAITIAMIHAGTDEPIEQIAFRIAAKYEVYADDDFANQWIDAAAEAIRIVEITFPDIDSSLLVASLKHLQICQQSYTLTGQKKKRKLLGGTWFNKAKEPDYNRVEKISRNLQTYNVLLMSGQIE